MDGTDWRLRVRDLLARMGLVAVFLHASSMSTAQIVDVQGQPFTFFGTDFGFPYTETNLARSLGIVVAHMNRVGPAAARKFRCPTAGVTGRH